MYQKSLKKTTLYILAVFLLISSMAFPSIKATGGFYTDTDGHWAETYIDKWSASGVIVGFGDGTFHPDDNVTKAEFSSVLNQIFKYSATVPNTNTFADVKHTDWFASIIQKVVAAGVVSPDADNMINPNKALSRGELFVMIAKAYNIMPVAGETTFLDDAGIDVSQKPYVKALQEKGLIVGYQVTNGFEIRTGQLLTRAEMLTVLDKAIERNPSEVTPAPAPSDLPAALPPGRSSGNAYPPVISPELTPAATPDPTSPSALSLTINTDNFDPLDEDGVAFSVPDKVSAIAGTLSGAADAVSLHITISSGNLVSVDLDLSISENWQYPNPNLIMEASNTVLVTARFKDGARLERSIQLINENEDNFDESVLDAADNDGDGIPNWLEDVFGTDKNSSDTDGDGLSDYDEIYITFTNPFLSVTDENGISDGEGDFDGDGLSNIQECFYGTNPFNPDTDGDGLTDYDEVFTYFSDPLKLDSDDDGLLDYLEIKYGMKPNNPDTLDDGVLDGDRIFTVTVGNDYIAESDLIKPFLLIDVKGKDIESLSIDRVSENDNFLNTGVPGYIGNAFDFNVEVPFSSARLGFELDSSLFNDPEFVPAIYYWDEDTQFLFELPNQEVRDGKVSAQVDQKIVLENVQALPNGQDPFTDNYPDITQINDLIPEMENVYTSVQSLSIQDDLPALESDSMLVSTEVDHFSTYMVLAKNIHDGELFRFHILPPTDEKMQNKKFDLVLVLDESGSISSANYSLIKKLAGDLVSKLDDDDKIAIYTFASVVRRRTGFVDKASAASTIASLTQKTGSTAIYNAIDSANNELITNSSADSTKIIILLTDGQDNASTVSASIATQTAVQNKIISGPPLQGVV